ncbi:MAG: nucleotidyl transferase AbiEii/AbiGii toxin family protein [Lentimicrobium sp.]
MHDDYYQNTLYPLQDKVLEIVGKLPVGFYLTGGTALSRGYLHHRYSDDLDFFVNGVPDFKMQVNTVIKALANAGHLIDTSVADDGFARIFVFEDERSLKLDFVNDVPFRTGTSVFTPLFIKTDNLNNILSNKVTALGRYATKDVVDIVYICESFKFNWEAIMNDASEKDLWVNPINVTEVLEQFPLEKLLEINWMIEPPTPEWFNSRINQIIADILDGSENSLHQ